MENVLKVKKLNPLASLPLRATKFSAGCDLFACIEQPITVGAGEIVTIPTGIAIEPPSGFAALIFGRSGLGARHGITLANSVGVVDEDFRGEIAVALINHGGAPYEICPDERIAQLVLVPVNYAVIENVQSLAPSQRGAAGFGSTGRT